MFDHINNRNLILITIAVSFSVALVGLLTDIPMLFIIGILALLVGFLLYGVSFIREDWNNRRTIAQLKVDRDFIVTHHVVQENELPDGFRYCPVCGGELLISNEPIDKLHSRTTGRLIRKWYFVGCKSGYKDECGGLYPIVINIPDPQPVFTEATPV